jgi:YVTN family beta-propeller protein
MISNAKKVYVTDYGSGDLYIIDPNTMQVSDVTANNFTANELHGPVAIDDVEGRIFVANYRANTVSVIDGKNNTKIEDINGFKDSPTPMAIDDAFIYVAISGSDSVSVIDGKNNYTKIKDIPVEHHPTAMAIDEIGPEPHLVYVANYGSDSVSVIYGSNLMAGLSLNAKPSLGGRIVCNKIEVPPDVYFYRVSHGMCS